MTRYFLTCLLVLREFFGLCLTPLQLVSEVVFWLGWGAGADLTTA